MGGPEPQCPSIWQCWRLAARAFLVNFSFLRVIKPHVQKEVVFVPASMHFCHPSKEYPYSNRRRPECEAKRRKVTFRKDGHEDHVTAMVPVGERGSARPRTIFIMLFSIIDLALAGTSCTCRDNASLTKLFPRPSCSHRVFNGTLSSFVFKVLHRSRGISDTHSCGSRGDTDPITVGGLFPGRQSNSHRVCRCCWHTSCRSPVQLMMNVGDQNGLEAWGQTVRAEQPVSGANKIAAIQPILHYTFSPGFGKLEEELRTFEEMR